MIVRITRIMLAVQLLLALGITAAVVNVARIDSAALAMLLGVAVVLLLRLSITANNFYLSWRFRSETPQAFRLNWRQACKLFFGEYRATMTASSLTMPFCAFVSRTAENPTGLPVLLIHGYGCNSGYWRSMSKALLQAGVSHRAVDMEPVTGGIDDYVPLIHQAVEALCRETGSEKIVIVAHSMGGLAARAYLRNHGPRRIAKVITLGTPHRGTSTAQFGIGLNCRQMHWAADEQGGLSSEWLRNLAAGENQDVYALFVSIYSHHDNIVAPQTSSHLPGATNVELYGIGHVALAPNPAVQARVIKEIHQASQHVSKTPATMAP
jgi:triacylglycerol lipase